MTNPVFLNRTNSSDTEWSDFKCLLKSGLNCLDFRGCVLGIWKPINISYLVLACTISHVYFLFLIVIKWARLGYDLKYWPESHSFKSRHLRVQVFYIFRFPSRSKYYNFKLSTSFIKIFILPQMLSNLGSILATENFMFLGQIFGF